MERRTRTQEKEIKNIFDLAMKVALNTDHQISFEFSTVGELSTLYLFDVRGGLILRKFVINLYGCVNDYTKAKKFLQGVLDREVQE